MNDTYTEKMAKIKKLVFIGFIVSAVLALATLVLFIVYNFAGVFTIKTPDGSKYQNGYTYAGWQSIYFGMGDMMIQGYTESEFNIITCLANLLPIFAILILEGMYLSNLKKKGTNKKKAIFEFIMAGLILVGAILLFNCDNFWIASAKRTAEGATGSYANYYEEYLTRALNGEEYFRKTAYPTILLIVGLLTAIVKALNGGLLIYQKKFAKSYKTQTTATVTENAIEAEQK